MQASEKGLDIGIQVEFLREIPHWIRSSKLNSINGLDRFPIRRLTSGITQAFDDFYIRYNERVFKFLPGEYPYLRRYVRRYELLTELTANDALVISAPFSATGHMHPRFYDLLRSADKLQVPVFVDCAFLGVTRNLDLDLNHRCVKSVGFSLSKAFGAGCFRAGIEFSRDEGGPSAVQNEWTYVQLLSAKICLDITRRYSPDYVPEKYRPFQEGLCREYGLQPSDTVLFGLGGDAFRFFDIDGAVNRVCLTPSIRSAFAAAAARAG